MVDRGRQDLGRWNVFVEMELRVMCVTLRGGMMEFE